MPRAPRTIDPGVCYHVLNRGNAKQPLFHKPADYEAFIAILADGLSRYDVELLCWSLMPNHWHLLLRPRRSDALQEFMRWITVTHVRRHHLHYQSPPGHLYQGRYKSFPVQQDDYFLILCRYIEANARRAKMVKRAEDWTWSSLHQRENRLAAPPLTDWPVDRPRGWIEIVNEPLPGEVVQAVSESITRDRPLGSTSWVKRIAKRQGLEQTLRSVGRPRKEISALSKRQLRRRRMKDGHNGK